MKNPFNIKCPKWVIQRDDSWQYCGWDDREYMHDEKSTWESRKKAMLEAEPGQIREIDDYPQGSVLWVRDVNETKEKSDPYAYEKFSFIEPE